MFPSVTLLFVRHGQQQTEDGAIGRLSPLSERGRLQAGLLATELAAGPRLGAVYASPLPRASATAAEICSRLDLVPILDTLLAEFELGTKPIAQIAERSDLLIWRSSDMGADGETLAAFSERVSSFCNEIVVCHGGQRIVVVAHAGTIDAAVRWALGITPADPWQHELEVQHASITEVEFWPHGRIVGGSPRYAVVRRVNHIVHLGDLATDL